MIIQFSWSLNKSLAKTNLIDKFSSLICNYVTWLIMTTVCAIYGTSHTGTSLVSKWECLHPLWKVAYYRHHIQMPTRYHWERTNEVYSNKTPYLRWDWHWVELTGVRSQEWLHPLTTITILDLKKWYKVMEISQKATAIMFTTWFTMSTYWFGQ